MYHSICGTVLDVLRLLLHEGGGVTAAGYALKSACLRVPICRTRILKNSVVLRACWCSLDSNMAFVERFICSWTD